MPGWLSMPEKDGTAAANQTPLPASPETRLYAKISLRGIDLEHARDLPTPGCGVHCARYGAIQPIAVRQGRSPRTGISNGSSCYHLNNISSALNAGPIAIRRPYVPGAGGFSCSTCSNMTNTAAEERLPTEARCSRLR